MTGLHTVPADRLGTVLAEFGRLSWPAGGHEPIVGEVTLNVSNWSDAAPAAELEAAHKTVRDAVAAAISDEARLERWQNPRSVWDLSSGGRVVVQQLDHVVILKLLSREVADLERTEEQAGIAPNRPPGTGHEAL